MTEFKVLVEGYAKKTNNGWVATSSTTLITNENKKILVDPGINRGLLTSKLEKIGLKTGDIDMVFLTHYHPDHSFLAGIFEEAIMLDGYTIYEKDKEAEYTDTIPGTNISAIPTPGHALEHHSLVLNTKTGKVAISGDVFWWSDQEAQKTDRKSLMERQDPFVLDKKALVKSREKLLELADWIIPGHGKMFKVP